MFKQQVKVWLHVNQSHFYHSLLKRHKTAVAQMPDELPVQGSGHVPWGSWRVCAETHGGTLQPTAVISRKRTGKLNRAIPDLPVYTGLVEMSRWHSGESGVATSPLCYPEIHEALCQMCLTHEAGHFTGRVKQSSILENQKRFAESTGYSKTFTNLWALQTK